MYKKFNYVCGLKHMDECENVYRWKQWIDVGLV